MGQRTGVPEPFARTILDVFGDAGVRWLRQLPEIVAGCQQRWAPQVGQPFALSYNYVAPAVRADGARVVLKLGVPGSPGLRCEAEALRLMDGRGVARLLEHDPDQGAMLLERLEPGTPLAGLVGQDDPAATTIAASVMAQLWRPVPAGHRFPTVAGWGRGFARHRAAFGGTSGPLPTDLFDRAERLFAELAASMAEPMLLHGDLHHDNILAAQRRPWLAIDPKGLVGEPAYETGALLRNPMPELLRLPGPGRVLARRVDQLAEQLGVDRVRVRRWGFAQAVLSAVWSVEDHGGGWEPALICAELLGTA